MHGGQLCFYRAAVRCETSLDKMIAKELGSVQNIITTFLVAVEQEHCWGVARSFHPFDSWWSKKSGSDAVLPESEQMGVHLVKACQDGCACTSLLWLREDVFQPLAKSLDIEAYPRMNVLELIDCCCNERCSCARPKPWPTSTCWFVRQLKLLRGSSAEGTPHVILRIGRGE